MTLQYKPDTITAMIDPASSPDVGPANRPRRPFYGWWILVVCCLLAVLGGAATYNSALFVVPMRDDLDFRAGSAAIIFLYATAFAAVAGLLVGWLADRFGARPLVLFGGFAAAGGLLLASPANSHWHFLVTFAIAFAGATVGFSMITLLSTVNRWFIRRRPVAMATLLTMFSLGPACVPLLVAWGMSGVGWRNTLLGLGVFLCILTVVACLVLRNRPEDMSLQPDGDASPPSIPEFRVRDALRTGPFWAMVLGGVVLNDSTQSAVEAFSPILTAVMAALAILLTFVLGVTAVWIPPRKILSGVFIAGAMGHLAWLVLNNEVGTVGFLSGNALVQGGSAVYWIMAGDYFGRQRFASLMGVLIFFRAVGSIIPGIIGALLDQMGYREFSLVFYILFYVAVALIIWASTRPLRLLPAANLAE
ncbi:MAG: MFS transporter [Chloroflexi bacterium]|nr:MFS transporter [Chloroflexota bacterium]